MTTLSLFLILLAGQALCKDVALINFIQSFVENEKKPTFLICDGLCWSKSSNVFLVKQMSKIGILSSWTLRHTKSQTQAALFLVDLECPRSEEHLTNASNSKLFASPYRWLILNTMNDTRSKFLWSLPLLPDSDLVLAERNDDKFKLIELHKASRDGPMYFNSRGDYNKRLVDTRVHRENYRRRKDLMGYPITMSIVIQASNTSKYHLEDRLELDHDVIAKVSWIVAKLAFEALNATPNYIINPRFGYKINGKWTGMISDIQNGRADIGTTCAIMRKRLEVIQYTDTLSPFRLRFVFRQPPLSSVSNIFTLPFSTSVWVAVTICCIFSAATLYITTKWEVIYGKSTSQLDGTVSDAVLVTMSALTQQGCNLEPKKTSGRIMLIVVFVALMALYTAYSANIVVLLQAPSSSIRTLDQLAQSKITLAANDVDYNYFLFGMYPDPLRMAITKKVNPEKGKKYFYDIDEGIKKMRQGLFALHSVVEPMYRRIEKTFLEIEKCDLVEIDFVMGFNPASPVKKDSPYLELLKVSFKQLEESGLKAAINKRLQIPKPQCSHKVSAFNSVGIMDLRPVLILILYGTAVSIIVLLIEIIAFLISQKYNKRWHY